MRAIDTGKDICKSNHEVWFYYKQKGSEAFESDSKQFSPLPIAIEAVDGGNKQHQQEVADYVGVTRQAVAQWKNRKTAPDMYSFKKVAEFFGVPA